MARGAHICGWPVNKLTGPNWERDRGKLVSNCSRSHLVPSLTLLSSTEPESEPVT